ncbi:MAG TPA: hypothetical protein VG603_09645 [Chitinophagales bacterium]|nr:hypothetical protein [Chitinophagales bacterium]
MQKSHTTLWLSGKKILALVGIYLLYILCFDMVMNLDPPGSISNESPLAVQHQATHNHAHHTFFSYRILLKHEDSKKGICKTCDTHHYTNSFYNPTVEQEPLATGLQPPIKGQKADKLYKRYLFCRILRV